MANEGALQDPEHAKKMQELQRATELAEAEVKRLEADRKRLDAQKELDARKSREADDELKAKIAAETSAKQLADAEKARIDAQRALERVRKPPDAGDEALQAKAVTAKAEKEVAEAQKAAADAAKAHADADLAAFKARFGDVPVSPYKGDVTLKEHAGKTEALLLAAQAVRRAAAAISEEIKANPGEVMLIASPDVPTFDNLMRFRVEIGIVEKALDEVDRLSSAARGQEPADDGTSAINVARAPKRERAVPPVAAAGLGLEAVDKLLGFFKTDYTVGGIDLALEDAILVNELAGQLTHLNFTVYLPKIFNANELTRTGAGVIAELEALALRRANSGPVGAAHERRAAEWTSRAAAETDEEKKRAMTTAAQAHQQAVDAIRKATALYDGWFDKLSSQTDKTGTVPIVAVIREQAMMNALDNGRSLLVVKIHAAGGSYYTRKNIWTVFGGMPFFHAGGTVVSFALIAGNTGAVVAAGAVPVHGGFFKASRLADEIALRPGSPARER